MDVAPPDTAQNFILHLPEGALTLSLLFVGSLNPAEKHFVLILPKQSTQDAPLTPDISSLYKSFIDSTFELVFQCDQQGHLTYHNQVFVSALDFPLTTEQETPTRKIHDILLDDFEKICSHLAQHGKVWQQEVRLKRANGGLLRGLANVCVYETPRGEMAYNWVVLDLTQYTEYEEYLQSMNSELKKVSFQLERFLYSASHDLRSPITSILGLVNLVKMESSNKHVIEYADRIETSANRLDNLIKNLAFLSMITYQKSGYERVSLSKLLWQIIQPYQFHYSPQ